MTSHNSDKSGGTANLQVLEQRLARLENELAFLREHGLSEDEQSHVLDGRDTVEHRRGSRALLWVVMLFNAGLIIWCGVVSWLLWNPLQPAASAVMEVAPTSSSIAPLAAPAKIESPTPEKKVEKIEDFSLPPRSEQP